MAHRGVIGLALGVAAASWAIVFAGLPGGAGGPATASARASSDRVWVAGGWFRMGSRQAEVDYARRLCVQERLPDALRLRGCADEILFGNELGERRVYLATYAIDRLEVTREGYARCVAAGQCTPSHLLRPLPGLTEPDRPVSAITWDQARQVCAFRGGRLPTEAEWERAARGFTRRRFPWGRQYNEGLANHGAPAMELDPLEGRPDRVDGFHYAAPVGSYPDGASPEGALDMAGNVWEWTADGYAPLSKLRERVEPRGAGGTGLRVVRGGSWRSPGFTLRVTHRDARPEGGHWVDVGVRCAYDPGTPPRRQPGAVTPEAQAL